MYLLGNTQKAAIALVTSGIGAFCIHRGWEFDTSARWPVYAEAAVCQLLREHPCSHHGQEPEQVLAESQPE